MSRPFVVVLLAPDGTLTVEELRTYHDARVLYQAYSPDHHVRVWQRGENVCNMIDSQFLKERPRYQR